MPWWANIAWCAIFVLLLRSPRLGVGFAAVALVTRILAVLSSVGTVWMLSGFAWLSVLAFYAMTVLWPVLLVLLWRRRAAALAAWMLPLAALEGAGALASMAEMLTGALLGAPKFGLRPVSAALFAVGQVFFLLRTARIS